MTAFAHRMADLAERWWQAEVADPPSRPLGHRELMRRVAAAVALRLAGRETDPARLATAVRFADELAALQAADGLFTSDGNLLSPPDSAFALNDLAVTLRLIDDAEDPALAPLRERLADVAQRAMPALVSGGVHTPNHRWEVSAALVRLRAFDAAAVGRAEEWLGEGVDVDADGIYSERSANYAAFVSNPSLLALADELGRSDLLEIVHRNLHAQLDLADADGVVETVYSRRQDQGGEIPLAAFHTQLRRFALGGCDVCTTGASVSEPASPALAVAALLELLEDPGLSRDLPPRSDAVVPAVSRHFPAIGVLVRQDAGVRSVVYGGSDVPHVGRIGSGLAGNPTFLRFRSGAAVIRSLRLSRVFFGLGPFRAESLVVDDGVARLHESLAARYYQPLPAGLRRDDGQYRLADDGRFHASMAFDERRHDDVGLVTDLEVRASVAGAELRVTTSGVDTRFALEIALGEGELTGVEQVADMYRMTGKRAELRNGSDAVVIETSLDPEPEVTGFYAPGEAFSFLGGTDALAGPRLYLTGSTPGRWAVTFRPAVSALQRRG